MDILRVDILDQDKLERKHNVRANEVYDVMRSEPRIRFLEKGQHPNEDAYVAYVLTASACLTIESQSEPPAHA